MLRTTLLHDGWQVSCARWLAPPGKVGFSKLEWLPARVPGHVHLDLQRNQVIGDPFRGLHELGCQWVDEEDWVYRTTFEFAPDPVLPRRVLRFEGLDTVATVFLNGAELARHDDMFVPLELDVTDLLRRGTNELRVELESAVRVGRQRRARYLAAQGLDPATVRFDEQAFVRKAQYMFGWDWGPRLVSAGIWQPVSLVEHAGRLLDVRSRQRHLEGGNVELTVTTERQDGGQRLDVLHFLEGRDAPLRDGEPVRLERPEKWFPAGIGGQRLHRLESFLVPAGMAERRDAVERRALDRRSMRIGLRDLLLVREPDAHGESFELVVNGERIWCLGANWIPDHSFPSRVTPERVRAQLLRARDLNMNMLRVWGGGLYESDAFYDVCDELGLLVWQDFAYACSYYPDDEAAQEVARREARAAVRRLRNHAEPGALVRQQREPGHVPGRVGGPGPAPAPPPRRAHLRPRPARGAGGARSRSPLRAQLSLRRRARERRGHRRPALLGRVARPRRLEALPGLDRPLLLRVRVRLRARAPRPPPDGLRRTATRCAGPPDAAAARWHDKTGKPPGSFRELVELHYPAARDLEEWAYFSQLNQRDALRHGIEHWRRSTSCRGALVWQLNDCWPVQSWSVLDVEAEPKAAAFELRRLHGPALASLERQGDVARLWAILDNARAPVRGTALLEARSTRERPGPEGVEGRGRARPGGAPRRALGRAGRAGRRHHHAGGQLRRLADLPAPGRAQGDEARRRDPGGAHGGRSPGHPGRRAGGGPVPVGCGRGARLRRELPDPARAGRGRGTHLGDGAR